MPKTPVAVSLKPWRIYLIVNTLILYIVNRKNRFCFRKLAFPLIIPFKKYRHESRMPIVRMYDIRIKIKSRKNF